MPSFGCVQMRPPLLLGTPWSSMAVKRCSDVRGSRLRHESAGGDGRERDPVPTHESGAVSSPGFIKFQGRSNS